MKTIYFGKPDDRVKDLRTKGVEVLVAEDPIKYLKAMKNAKDKGNYTVLADKDSTKYLEFSRKIGYNEYSEPKKEPPKPPPREEPEFERVINRAGVIEDTVSIINEGYKRKLKEESQRIEAEYQDKMRVQSLEYSKLAKELEKERDQLKKIKETLRKEIYNK